MFKLMVIFRHGLLYSVDAEKGDPISPYIVLLCAEILAVLIRNNKHVFYVSETSQWFSFNVLLDMPATRSLLLSFKTSVLLLNPRPFPTQPPDLYSCGLTEKV